MKEVYDMIEKALGNKIPLAALFHLAPLVTRIGRDLTDGNPRISASNRADLQEVLDKLKRGEAL